MIALVTIVAGGAGSLARYEVGGWVQRRAPATFPWGTATVNLVGAAALGVVVGAHASGALGGDGVEVAGTGFLGGFTTFSTWMVESVVLVGSRDRRRRGVAAALANVVGMLLAGVVTAGAAIALV